MIDIIIAIVLIALLLGFVHISLYTILVVFIIIAIVAVIRGTGAYPRRRL